MTKRIASTLAAIALILGFIAVASPASAADLGGAQPNTGCTIFNNISIDIPTTVGVNGSSGYRVKGLFTKPAPGCHDLQFKDCQLNATYDSYCTPVLKVHDAGTAYHWVIAGILSPGGSTWTVVWANMPTGQSFELYAYDNEPITLDMMY